ncbi:hypothetical protein IF650_01060 [Cellulosimicrobium terreum]|nr:hypothetical protein [Cellulosimicrobium terreum]
MSRSVFRSRSTTVRPLRYAAVPLLLVTAALASCHVDPTSLDESVADVTYLGMPVGTGALRPPVDPEQHGIGYARGAEAQTVYVVTVGSRSCPLTPVDVEWDAADRTLEFRFGRRPTTDERPCTVDVVPSTSVVHVPGLPDDEPVTVRTGAGAEVVLPAAR